MSKKIIKFSLSGILFILIGFSLAYIIFNLRLEKFKEEIIEGIKSNNIIKIDDSKEETNIETIEDKIITNIQKTKESVVNIIEYQKIGSYTNNESINILTGLNMNEQIKMGGGNGIVISEDGFILTNKNILNNPNSEYKITDFRGNTYKPEKVRSSEKNSFSIVKLKYENGNSAKDMLPISITAGKDQTKVGQQVFAIGNTSKDNINSVTKGIISSKNMKIQGNNIGLYQTDAKIFRNNNGGPIINTQGDVIGISIDINNNQGLPYILPLKKEFISRFFSSIERNSKISTPSLGFDFIEINPGNKQKLQVDVNNGVLITEISKESEAEKRGLKIGDIVTGINGDEINNNEQFLRQLYTYEIGDKIVLNILRGNKKIDIDVFLGEI